MHYLFNIPDAATINMLDVVTTAGAMADRPRSDRLPAYRRLDGQLSYYRHLGDGDNLIAFVSTSNILDRVNVLGYEYSADYTERHAERTNFSRSFYFGITINWSL